MRVLVIGDSLVLPRLEYDYDDTWLAKLIKEFPDIQFIEKLRRSSSSMRLVNDGAGAGDLRRGADLLEYYNPDLVITQIGITDSSPRLLKRNKISTKVVISMPRCISNFVFDFFRKFRGRIIENNDLSPDEFRRCWVNYIERANKTGTQILCILIAPGVGKFLESSPLINKSVSMYNQVLIDLEKKYSNFTTLESFTFEEMSCFACDDGMHVNAQGQYFLYNKIAKWLDGYIKENKI